MAISVNTGVAISQNIFFITILQNWSDIQLSLKTFLTFNRHYKGY